MDKKIDIDWLHPKSLFEKSFVIGILFKGIDGLIELLLGFVFLFLSPEKLNNLVVFATHQELSSDPHDFLANLLINSSQHYTNGGRYFLVAYLWVHAAVKLIAVIGILRNKLWAYPFSLITLGIFTVYQLYEIIFVKVSFTMVLLTVFDVFIIWLIWREYGKIKNSTSYPGVKKID
ncbi:MAG: DUF2127 domain-containing protein [Candidatus Saccharibacteria bacterium]|nr:DUF2127 domain-containing protein [Candidatus Saccharibacteria bacterium]